MPTDLPSVATFTDPGVTFPGDPKRNPTQATAYWLGRDIVRGVFLPLERLKVEQLTQFYAVGHSPIREAILLLSATGLVVHEHQRGYRVAPVSLDDYDDLTGVYQRFYKLALGMAIELGDDAWEERVVVRLHRSLKVRKVLPGGDPEARELWQRAYGELHSEILSGCGSPLMLRMFGGLGARMERYVNLFADLESDRERDHHAEHRAIVDALVARDAGRVDALITGYFATGQPIRESIKASLKRKAASPARTAAASPVGSRRRGRPRKAC